MVVGWLVQGVKPHQPKQMKGRRKLYGQSLIVTGVRIEDDYLLVVTGEASANNLSHQAIDICALLGKGFHFEARHMTHRDAIKKLVAVLAIAFCWAHLTGE